MPFTSAEIYERAVSPKRDLTEIGEITPYSPPCQRFSPQHHKGSTDGDSPALSLTPFGLELATSSSFMDPDVQKRLLRENPSGFGGQSRTHALLELTTDGFVALDDKLRVTYLNEVSEKFSGTSRNEARGKSYLQVCPELTGSLVQKEFNTALKTGTSREFEYFHESVRKWFFVRAHPTRAMGLWVFFQDITERKQALHEAEMAHQRTFEILESISDAFFAVDDAWRFTYVNTRAEQAWGCKREHLLGRVVWDEFPNAVATDFFVNLRRAIEHRQRVRFVATSPRGREIQVDAHPCIGGMCVYFRQLEWSVLRRLRQSSREIAEQVVAAREEESQRIARELHDGASQLVAALSVGLRALEEVRTIEEVRLRVLRLRTIAKRTVDELTQFTHGLHTSVLRESGLLGSIQKLASDTSKTHELPVHLEVGPLSDLPLSISAQESVYRIVQEALSNAVKHSGATLAVVGFRYCSPVLEVKITDDGRGFNPRDSASRSSLHLGLRTMRERSEMLGGNLSIESSPGHGTRIIARIPVSKTKVA